MKNNLKKFIAFLFILPIVPTILLWLKSERMLAITIFSTFWGLGFACLISKAFAQNFKKCVDKIFAFIGKYLAIVTLFLGYIAAVIPTSLIMKITKRDRLKLSRQNVSSYWLDEKETNKDYERQY